LFILLVVETNVHSELALEEQRLLAPSHCAVGAGHIGSVERKQQQ